jgi:acyl-coenzyme A thioesterase PaaI-like protein
MAGIGNSEFDEATSVAPDGSTSIRPGWDINGNANGGYLLALAARHLLAVAGRPDPLTVTAHYLSPGTAGPVQVDGEVVKQGKRLVTLTGSMRRGDRLLLQLVGAFGDARFGGDDVEYDALLPPDLPPFEECAERTSTNGPAQVPLMDHLQVRIDPAQAGYQRGEKSGEAVMTGWFAFADGRPMDTLALLLAADAFPPAVFNLELPPGWVPTVEMTVHVRERPAEGPLRCRFLTRHVANGMFEEDGEVWDSRGRLVAMSRQLALLARA